MGLPKEPASSTQLSSYMASMHGMWAAISAGDYVLVQKLVLDFAQDQLPDDVVSAVLSGALSSLSTVLKSSLEQLGAPLFCTEAATLTLLGSGMHIAAHGLVSLSDLCGRINNAAQKRGPCEAVLAIATTVVGEARMKAIAHKALQTVLHGTLKVSCHVAHHTFKIKPGMGHALVLFYELLHVACGCRWLETRAFLQPTRCL